MDDVVTSLTFNTKRRSDSFGSPSTTNVDIDLSSGERLSYVLPLSCGQKLQRNEDEYIGAARQKMSALVEDILMRDAQVRSHRILGQREHSVKELKEKLERYPYPSSIIDAVVDECIQSSFVNDKRFAEIFIRSKRDVGWGMHRINRELALRGIETSEIEGYPEQFFDSDDEYDRALDFINRRRVPEHNAYQKLFRLLYSRGFDASIARRAVTARMENPED